MFAADQPVGIWLTVETSDRLIWDDARSGRSGCDHTTSARRHVIELSRGGPVVPKVNPAYS